MRAHYETGERLRKRWGDDWLGSYSPSKVFVRSTDVNRTLQSAFSQLAGLFPEGTGPLAYAPAHPDEPRPTGVRANEPALPNRGQPVAITSVAAPRDHMLRAWDNCGRFREYLKALPTSKEWVAYAEENKDTLAALGKLAGWPADQPLAVSLRAVYLVQDAWVCEEAHGLPLSPAPGAELRLAARRLADWGLTAMFAGHVDGASSLDPMFGGDARREVARLTGGMLVTAIVSALERADRGLEAPKLSLFSAHDTTVAALLSALRCFDNRGPPYNSTVVFELHRKAPSADSEVRAWYNGSPLSLPGAEGDAFPTLEAFAKAVNELGLIVTDDELFAACGASADAPPPPPATPSASPPNNAPILLAVMGGIALGAAATAGAGYVYVAASHRRAGSSLMGNPMMWSPVEEDASP